MIRGFQRTGRTVKPDHILWVHLISSTNFKFETKKTHLPYYYCQVFLSAEKKKHIDSIVSNTGRIWKIGAGRIGVWLGQRTWRAGRYVLCAVH